MPRLLSICLCALVFLGGCAPKDPLDRKVKAATPDEFARWWHRTQKKFPDRQRAEVQKVARYLQDSTPRLHAMKAEDHNDPLCQQIDGLTVRQLLVLGYEESSHNLRNRILLETGKLAPLVTAASESEDAASRNHAATLLAYTRGKIEDWNDTIAQNDRRIAELNSPSPASEP